MRKKKSAILALVLALVMTIPTMAIARSMDDVPQRTENGVVYAALRLTAYAHGATVEWNGETRTVYITDAGGNRQDVVVEAVGGFIEDGTSWIPFELANRLFQHSDNDRADIALDFMGRFATGDIPGMVQMMAEEMQAGAEMFAILHQDFSMRRGSFIDWEIANYQTYQDSIIYDIGLNNVLGRSIIRITVNSIGEIAGFSDMGFMFEPLPVDENATFVAEAVVIGKGTRWELDGLLTIPNEASAENPVPAVLLVPGSGANNMDSAIFYNRPFHDIATYLSSNNIAVLRYNERVFAHGTAFVQAFGNSFTLQEEYTEDVLLAIEILRADPRISRVYIAGHSLGGFVASGLAEKSGADGVIILAGSPRPLHYWLYDQNVDFFNNAVSEGLLSQEEADEQIAMVADLFEEVQNLPNLTEYEIQDMMVWGGFLSAVYARSFFDFLPLPIISRNTIPTSTFAQAKS